MKRLTLKANAGDLPLAWEAGERLAGRKREGPYRAGTKAITGKALDKSLAGLGVGPKRITVEGRFQPADQPMLQDLPLWDRSTTVAGTLDAQALGFAVHELTRRFREAEKSRLKGEDTPREAYVTTISIRSLEQPAGERRVVKLSRKVRGKRKPVQESVIRQVRTRYFDTERGKFVKKETWERSRRSIRARTPKGQTPKTGRYVKRTYS